MAAARPRAVFVVVGTNGVPRGLPQSATSANLRSLLERAWEQGIAAHAATVPSVRAGTQASPASVASHNGRILDLDDWIRASVPAPGAAVVGFSAPLPAGGRS